MKAQTQTFRPTALAIGVIVGFALFWVLVILGMFSEGLADDWMYGIPGAFLLLSFCAWPRSIHCDENGMWQRTFYGKKKRIRYKEIADISCWSGTITVLSCGATLKHTRFHVGSLQFVELLSKVTGTNIAEPSQSVMLPSPIWFLLLGPLGSGLTGRAAPKSEIQTLFNGNTKGKDQI